MKGAREYAKLFKTGQYGRLYITSSKHAKEEIFFIQVLPKNEKAITKGYGANSRCLNPNAVTVYGLISENPEQDETYGWLHHGKWQQDFHKLVAQKRKELKIYYKITKKILLHLYNNKNNKGKK